MTNHEWEQLPEVIAFREAQKAYNSNDYYKKSKEEQVILRAAFESAEKKIRQLPSARICCICEERQEPPAHYILGPCPNPNRHSCCESWRVSIDGEGWQAPCVYCHDPICICGESLSPGCGSGT